MADLFEDKSVTPMLIRDEVAPFDDKDYIYELKWDGCRCLAYLDKNGTELKNKRNLRIDPIFPELSQLHKQAKKRCVLDGELIVLIDGKPNFEALQRRTIMSNPVKIKLSADEHPASFIAYDILYYDNKSVTDLPVTERKKLIDKVLKENDRVAISRYVEENGKALFEFTSDQGLEGIVAKKKSSLYYPGKRTKDWVKIKNMLDDDFVICGYVQQENNMVSVILGQYYNDELVYKGSVAFCVRGENFKKIKTVKKKNTPPLNKWTEEGNIQWIEPVMVCTVKFMNYTKSGAMRQPVLKGIREDKAPEECVAKNVR